VPGDLAEVGEGEPQTDAASLSDPIAGSIHERSEKLRQERRLWFTLLR
jgi:hypothetical protein